VGGDSMIGQCVARAEARIALDVGEEPVRFDNPLLPETRSELALPLRSRGQVIGAMTIQSAEEAAFDEADIAVLQTMADQVAVAIDNARLFAEAQAALAEMEAIHRRYLGRAWAEYALARAISGYEQTDAGIMSLDDKVLPEVRQAVTEQRPVVWRGDGDEDITQDATKESLASALVVPILLRGQPIGALGFKEANGKRQWSAEDVALAEAIAEQLALAMDNLRLLDETQRRAARERLTSEVTARMRQTLDMENVLKTATAEFYRALGLEEVVIRLATEGTDEGPASESPTAVGRGRRTPREGVS
jgi:GAF domain-containing protein